MPTPRPSASDVHDAIDHADLDGDGAWSADDFAWKFLGSLSVRALGAYDDLSSWLDFAPGEHDGESVEERLDELRSFRGPEWAARAAGWLKTGIPPVIVITVPCEGRSMTMVGDGRGRVNFAALMGMRLPVWSMVHKSLLKKRRR